MYISKRIHKSLKILILCETIPQTRSVGRDVTSKLYTHSLNFERLKHYELKS